MRIFSEDPFAPLNQRGEYLRALALQEERLQAAAGAEERSMAAQLLSALRGFVGDTQGAHEAFDSVVQPDRTLDAAPDLPAALTGWDAVSEILRAAQGRQIVILNEAHHVPRGRAFALPLLLALRQQGFTHFAAETFGSDIAATVHKGYPNLGTGFYSLDPLFGDLVRQALRVGYTLVPYEARGRRDEAAYEEAQSGAEDAAQTTKAERRRALQAEVEAETDPIAWRESGQARNLVERIFKNAPDARVFLFVGFSHLMQTPEILPDGSERLWMAARLQELAGIHPLCIDQTEADECSRPEWEVTGYRDAINRFNITRPTVLRDEKRAYRIIGGYRDSVDMQVFHPPTRYVHGRPDWLGMEGYRRPFRLDPEWQPASGRALVQAFVVSEPEDAIPMDQTLLHADQPLPCLMLPAGEYRLALQQEDGTTRSLATITHP